MAWYLYALACCILISQFIGHFGNFNLVLLHYRLPKLRTNYGCLLVILTISQSICLLFENVNLFYAIYGRIMGHPIYRDRCFHIIFAVLFFNSFQQGIVTMIAVDLLICVLFPIRYRGFHQPFYLTILLIPPACHGLYLMISGFLYVDNSEVKLCNPPSALSPSISSINYFITLCTCLLTIVAYLTSFFLIYLKSRQRSKIDIESKTLKSLSVIVIVFIITRLLGMIAINLQQILNFSPESIVATQNFLVIPALVGFSQNFYVCYFRSKEYRQLFNTQLLPIYRFFRPNYELRKVFVADGLSKTNNLKALSK